MEFITQIQENKDSFTLFYEHAEKKGMMEKSPQRKFQYQYYDAYIKPQLNPSQISQYDPSLKPKAKTTKHRNVSVTPQEFIPLKDLLRRNHDDRV
jgi:hypothetical protein